MAERAFSTGADARPHPLKDASLRARMELAVERLLAAMDALEAADEDMEEDDAAEDGADTEPSLGSLNEGAVTFLDQRRWSFGGDMDLEDEHDGREPEEAA